MSDCLNRDNALEAYRYASTNNRGAKTASSGKVMVRRLQIGLTHSTATVYGYKGVPCPRYDMT